MRRQHRILVYLIAGLLVAGCVAAFAVHGGNSHGGGGHGKCVGGIHGAGHAGGAHHGGFHKGSFHGGRGNVSFVHKQDGVFSSKGSCYRPGSFVGVERFGGARYCHGGGLFFVDTPSGYFQATPPVGAIIPILPDRWNLVYVNGKPYYYSGGTYYMAVPSGYRVVRPAMEQMR